MGVIVDRRAARVHTHGLTIQRDEFFDTLGRVL